MGDGKESFCVPVTIEAELEVGGVLSDAEEEGRGNGCRAYVFEVELDIDARCSTEVDDFSKSFPIL